MFNKPDWFVLAELPALPLWRVVALTMDRDIARDFPTNSHYSIAISWWPGFEVFKSRMDFALGFASSTEEIPFCKNQPSDLAFDFRFVDLVAFGEWAQWKGWSLPLGYPRRPEVKTNHVHNPGTAISNESRALTKKQVMLAFEKLHFDYDHWGKNLASPPKWLEGCRVAKGSKKVSATWDPVLIAISLLDKGITIKKLDLVFMGLKDWSENWRENSEIFREHTAHPYR